MSSTTDIDTDYDYDLCETENIDYKIFKLNSILMDPEIIPLFLKKKKLNSTIDIKINNAPNKNKIVYVNYK